MPDFIPLKKYHILFLLIVANIEVHAQKIRFDTFGDLQYESYDRSYTASLKKNIFDDLIFKDNSSNEITFKKKHLEQYYRDLLKSKTDKIYFFQDLIDRYISESEYKATFDIDVFDNTVIKDNRGEEVEIGTDIFGNYQYESKGQGYSAYLKKNIFDDLAFTDNNNNEINFKKKYLELYYKNLLKDKIATEHFFRDLIDRHISDTDYKATYEVDIFNSTVITDNRGGKVEFAKDIFGNPTNTERTNNGDSSIRRDLAGNLEYTSDAGQAVLKKDIFNKWSYSDSSGNTFNFSENTWNKLMHRYVTEEDVFFYLIHKFLLL